MIKNRIAEHLAVKARDEGRSRYTQNDIVNETGLSQQTVSTQIRNKVKRYDLRVIATWCKFLGIKPSQFFADEIADNADISKEERPLLAIPA